MSNTNASWLRFLSTVWDFLTVESNITPTSALSDTEREAQNAAVVQWNTTFSKALRSVAGCIGIVALVLAISSFNTSPGGIPTSSPSLGRELTSSTCAVLYLGTRIGGAICNHIDQEQVSLRESFDRELKENEDQKEAAIREVQREAKENDRAAIRRSLVELVESGLIDEEESPVGLLDVAFAVTP